MILLFGSNNLLPSSSSDTYPKKDSTRSIYLSMIVPKNISHFPIFQVKCGSVESTTTSVCFQVGESWRRDQRKPRVIVFAILVEKKLSHNDDRERNIHLILKENTQIKSFILGTTMFHIHHIVQLCVHSTTCQAPIWQLKKKFDN